MPILYNTQLLSLPTPHYLCWQIYKKKTCFDYVTLLIKPPSVTFQFLINKFQKISTDIQPILGSVFKAMFPFIL